MSSKSVYSGALQVSLRERAAATACDDRAWHALPKHGSFLHPWRTEHILIAEPRMKCEQVLRSCWESLADAPNSVQRNHP